MATNDAQSIAAFDDDGEDFGPPPATAPAEKLSPKPVAAVATNGQFEDDDAGPPPVPAITPVEADDAWDAIVNEDVKMPTPPPVKSAASKTKKSHNADVVPLPAANRVVTLAQDLKLTKKQTESITAAWSGDNRTRARDLFMQGVQETLRKETGHEGYVPMFGSQTKNLFIGIPMFGGHDADSIKYPGCLALEYVFGQNVFPFGLLIQIVAVYGVGKSALAAEFARWFDLANGGSVVQEAETKFSPEWYESIMGFDSFERLQLNRCKSIEGWQRALSEGIRRYKKLLVGTKKEPGPGRTVPVLFVVDSVAGKTGEETQEKILGERSEANPELRGTTGTGAAGRTFPVDVQTITSYVKTISGELDQWPFSLVMINHLRNQKDDQGNPERKKSGGKQLDFQESFELEIKRLGGRHKIESLQFTGFPVEIVCEKSSFSETGNKVQTRLLWWDERDKAGNWWQRTIWDWDWSTVWLLNALRNQAGLKPRLRQNLIDIGFHIECPKSGEVENLAWSSSLGMKDKDALPWADVGRLFRMNRELLNKIRSALCIHNRPLLAGDYLKQQDQIAEENA
jgi:hypothetical protein